jgi:hypothetical protein
MPKGRVFGLTIIEASHAKDIKKYYSKLDSTLTPSFFRRAPGRIPWEAAKLTAIEQDSSGVFRNRGGLQCR